MTVGIENLKSCVHGVCSIIVEGIAIARKASAVIGEVKDLDIAEGVALVVEIATTEAPRVIGALK
jgi:hypothetical protein